MPERPTIAPPEAPSLDTLAAAQLPDAVPERPAIAPSEAPSLDTDTLAEAQRLDTAPAEPVAMVAWASSFLANRV